jgi:hypothetical protein
MPSYLGLAELKPRKAARHWLTIWMIDLGWVTADLKPEDWTLMAAAIAKWKSTMQEPTPSRVWSVELKDGSRMTMVSEDPLPITQDEALFFAKQRYFDAVLTVESLL